MRGTWRTVRGNMLTSERRVNLPRNYALRRPVQPRKILSTSHAHNEMSSGLDESRDQPPLIPSTGPQSKSPSLSRSAGLPDTESHEGPRKRLRAEDNEHKKPIRRHMACQSCRIRKVTCDNARPTCANGGSECVYIDIASNPSYAFLGLKGLV
jgi:hypothetical protein